MARRLDWSRDGSSWPHHERSRFVDAAGLHWHVQRWPGPHPQAPTLLLLHGTGASTHSWRDLAPLLAKHAALVAIDLPGHGFSGPAVGAGVTLQGMARSIASLLKVLHLQPRWLVGHSAGAAIAARMALDAKVSASQDPSQMPRAIVSLNGAFLPLGGPVHPLMQQAARLLALNPLVPHLFSWTAASEPMLQRLLQTTGSRLDSEGRALYARLVASPPHVAGALAMMANWNLQPLFDQLPTLSGTAPECALHLVVGESDLTVDPSQAQQVMQRVPQASLTVLPNLGHLAHEEQPKQVADLIADKLAWA